MKRLLIITHFFPPLGGMGSLRIGRFVSYLPHFGWYSHIHTPIEGWTWKQWVRDETLMANIPEGTEVTRTNFINLNTIPKLLQRIKLRRISSYIRRFLSVLPPDNMVGWIPFAYSAVKKITIEAGIDAIYTTSPLPSTHLIGYLLKRKTGLPWVVELRDEWSHNPARNPLFSWQRRVDRWLERKVLLSADKIIVTNDLYKSALISLLPDGSNNKVITITNSFETSGYGIQRSINNKFTITYVGLIDANRKETYARFLTILENLVHSGEISEDMIEFRFVGHIRSWFEYHMGSLLNKVVKDIGYLPHQEAIQSMLNADLLLLIAPTEAKLSVAGKTFEYLGSGKPILALVPSDGAAAQIIRKTNAGIVVNSMDTQAIKGAIREAYCKWEEGKPWVQPDWKEIDQYEINRLTRLLADTLDEICQCKHNS